jgi:hypothetical protein
MIHPISVTNYNTLNRNPSRLKTSGVIRFRIALEFGSLLRERSHSPGRPNALNHNCAITGRQRALTPRPSPHLFCDR